MYSYNPTRGIRNCDEYICRYHTFMRIKSFIINDPQWVYYLTKYHFILFAILPFPIGFSEIVSPKLYLHNMHSFFYTYNNNLRYTANVQTT